MQPKEQRARLIGAVATEDNLLSHLNEPCPLSKAVEAKLIGDLSSVHSVRKILLVGEDEEKGITELVLVEHPLQLLTRLRHTLPIVGIHHENDTLGVLEVCTRAISELRARKNL